MPSQIGLRKLVISVNKAWIEPESVSELDRGIAVPALIHVVLTRFKVLKLGLLWIARARAGE
jgi:hypothetical protein